MAWLTDRVVKRMGTIGVACSVAVRLAMMLLKRLKERVAVSGEAQPHSRCASHEAARSIYLEKHAPYV